MKLRNALIATGASLALAACATTSPGYGSGYGNGGYDNYGNGYRNGGYCADCGVVTRIDTVQGSSAPAATGAVVGGIVGAVAGREIARHNTDSQGRKNAATVAGAAAGAVVGNAIQNRNQYRYDITVRMDDGRYVTVSQSDLGNIREGSPVRVYDGRAWAR